MLPHHCALARSPAAFAFISMVSMAPDGPSTKGLLSHCSVYFAVASSHASNPFFHMSHPTIASSLMTQSPKRRTSAAVVKSWFISFVWLVARATSPKHSNIQESWSVTCGAPADGELVTLV